VCPTHLCAPPPHIASARRRRGSSRHRATSLTQPSWPQPASSPRRSYCSWRWHPRCSSPPRRARAPCRPQVMRAPGPAHRRAPDLGDGGAPDLPLPLTQSKRCCSRARRRWTRAGSLETCQIGHPPPARAAGLGYIAATDASRACKMPPSGMSFMHDRGRIHAQRHARLSVLGCRRRSLDGTLSGTLPTSWSALSGLNFL
jgi:hypothetical protein